MTDTPAFMSDDQIDELLKAVGDQLDIPPMADAAAVARARIERRGPGSRTDGRPDDVIPLPSADPTAIRPPTVEPERLGRDEPSRRRELALLAAGLAAAAIVALVLALIFRGLDGDDDDVSEPAIAEGPLAAEPYDIPGYELVTTAGQPQVPNEPVDVAIGSDGTQYVLDAGLQRVVAFTDDGEVHTDWGDEGFSDRIPEIRGAAIAVGPGGELYVAAGEVLVFDATGELVESWEFPVESSDESRSLRSHGLVVDSEGNIYVAGRSVVWKFDVGTGAASTIELETGTGIQLAIDNRDRLFIATIERGDTLEGSIYHLNSDGSTEFIGEAGGPQGINGFTVAPDGTFVVFQSSRGSNEFATFVILDSDGSEIANWPIDRTGHLFGNLGPLWFGIDIKSDGTIVLPDPMGHRIAYFDTEGSLISEIRDDRPDAFGRLWRISVDGEGNVLGYDPSDAPRVLRFAPDGDLLQEMPFEAALRGGMATLFDGNGFAATGDGGFIIANQQSNHISIYSPEGELVQEWGEMDATRSGGGLAFPDAVAVDHQGAFYIVDEGFAGRLVDNLRKFTMDGEFVTEVGSISYPARADIVHHDGAIWAVDDGSIVRYPDDGGEPQTIATPDTDEDGGELPGYALTLAIDPKGNILTYMFRLDAGQGQFPSMLAKLDPQGNVIWTADLAEDSANRYVDLAIAPDGTLYLSDSESRQILVYQPSEDTGDIESTPDDSDAEQDGHPLAVAPYEIPGFEFVATAGQPQIPNEPVDVAISPDGTRFVLDIGFDRIIAFTPDGEIRPDWGNKGFSSPISGALGASLEAGPDGKLYVAAEQILIFDETGRRIGTWSFPDSSNTEVTGLRNHGLVVDSEGNVYVPGTSIIWRFEAGTGAVTTIELDTVSDIQLAIDNRDQLYAATMIEGDVYRVGLDGTTEHLGQVGGSHWFNGFAVTSDGTFVLLGSSTTIEQFSIFVLLDSDGSEITNWTIDRPGLLTGFQNPLWIGIDMTPDGTIVLPDPLGQRVAFFDVDGTLETEIRDDRPDAFGWLWQIAVDGDGNVLGYDPSVDPKVLRFDPDGELLQSTPLHPQLLEVRDSIFNANGFAATEDGGFVIAKRSQHQVSIYSPEGDLERQWGEQYFRDASGLGFLWFPAAVTLDQDGSVFLVDQSDDENLKHFTIDGGFIQSIGTITPDRVDLTYRDGSIWTANAGGILRYPVEGGEPEIIATTNVGPSDGVLPGLPFTLTLDADGNIYVYLISEPEQGVALSTLAKLDPEGNVIWTVDLLEDSTGHHVDLAIAPDGTLYLSDSESRQILVYRPD